MSEYFLHYIWQFQYFDKVELVTADGEPIVIFHPGQRNIHSGPDFFSAHIRIGSMEWVGSVEIHIHASGWMDHHHNTDAAYENVVLHVVWENDQQIYRNDGSRLPVLVLKRRVEESLLENMKTLIHSLAHIPCSHSLHKLPTITTISTLDRVLVERLEARSKTILEQYERNHCDWEETCYQLLSRNFGFKVNADPFQQLSRSVPLKVILKQSDKLLHVEALLFGQAGFLSEKSKDDYHRLLRREYMLLSSKYGLREYKMERSQWRFLRLRPNNFPTLRIAQLASLLHLRKNIFSHLITTPETRKIKTMLAVEASAYWTTHYRFFKTASDSVPALGESSIDNVLINTVAPLLVAYGRWKDDPSYLERAMIILQEISSEQNAIVKLWTEPGMTSKSAFDSQALIELYSSYCQKRRCLDCTIGHSILNLSQR
jgi:hypothetical protein